MSKNKKNSLSFSEVVAINATLYFTLLLFARGVLFLTLSERMIVESPWYEKLVELVDITTFGYATIAVSVMMFMSIFSRIKGVNLLFAVSNLLAMFIYIFFSISGVEQSLNWFTPFSNIINANFHLIMALTGVYAICQAKNQNM